MLIRGPRIVMRAALFDSDHMAAAHGPSFPHSIAWIRTKLANPERKALAVEVQGRLRGYVELKLTWAEEVLSIEEFVVDAELLGQGYGSEALHALLEHFFVRWNGRRAELAVRADNERALRCYLAAGFVIEGRRRNVIPLGWGPPSNPDYLMLGIA